MLHQPHEHRAVSEPDALRCQICREIRLTVEIFRNGELLRTTSTWIVAPTETAAVDFFLRLVRIDFRYRFIGRNGFVMPSDPNDYLIWKG